MKKTSIIVAALILVVSTITTAQTTAVNWTATDCNSNNHTLFTELDNGKVIVFAWVMPCGTCINPSKTAYNVVQSFSSSHPGKVLLYVADDIGDANCASLTNWITTNNIGDPANMTLFSNAGNVINENDFGGTGMPHIVVMGGSNHTIFFNKKNGAANDATSLQKAINSAIGATGINATESQFAFSISPNPVMDILAVTYSDVSAVSILSLTGQLVRSEVYTNAFANPSLNISDLPAGLYMVKVVNSAGQIATQKFLKQ